MVKHLVIYVHGKGGNANEAEHYKPFFAESDVIGFDYQAQNPWEAQKEFSSFFELHSQRYDSVTLIANSIGAFFSMSALTKKTGCSGNPHFPGRKHGKINCGYDDVGERNRRRTVHQKGNFYGIWRNTFLGIPMLCTGTSHCLECANLYFYMEKKII